MGPVTRSMAKAQRAAPEHPSTPVRMPMFAKQRVTTTPSPVPDQPGSRLIPSIAVCMALKWHDVVYFKQKAESLGVFSFVRCDSGTREYFSDEHGLVAIVMQRMANENPPEDHDRVFPHFMIATRDNDATIVQNIESIKFVEYISTRDAAIVASFGNQWSRGCCP